jgi:sigma-B regulation protein RsbU (phosphoserine phosphatase)
LDVRSAMAVPLVCQSGNLGMLYVENDPDDTAYDDAALHVLSAVACAVSMPIENVLRKVTTKHRATVGTEQALARATQDALTLKALPLWGDLLLAAYRHMGSARCCDFYDVVQLRDKTASIVLVRITAQAEAVPRCFAQVRAAFRTAALYSEPPHLFARALNWVIFDGTPNHSIDFACAWIAPGTGKVQYCTAGRGVRLGRIHADGSCEMIEAGDLPPIGQTRAPAFTSQVLDLGSGDKLVLVTEGVLTASNQHQEAFGWAGLKENLCDGLGGTPGSVLSEFGEDLTEFLQGGVCPDDLTVVLAQRP